VSPFIYWPPASHIYVACLAAAKTIINEIKQDLPEESPIVWTTQAFSVAAAVSMFSLLSHAKVLQMLDYSVFGQFQSQPISSRIRRTSAANYRHDIRSFEQCCNKLNYISRYKAPE
jgi:hypothetical protein